MNSNHKKFKIDQDQQTVQIGAMLTNFFKVRRIHKNALARKLNRNRQTLVNFQKNNSIQTAILWEICLVLKHNFFADIACQLPPDFTSNAPQTEAEKQIAMLEEELIKLRAERDLLKRMVAEK